MLRLVDRKPDWLDLLPGVRVLMEPITRTTLRRARRSMAALLRPGEDGQEGVDADEDAGDALSHALITAGLRDWEGVGDAAGVAAPVTPENVALLLEDPDAFAAFERLYVMPFIRASAEKNGLSALPNGTGRAGTVAGDTVRLAAKAKEKAVAPPAPTPSKPRKARKPKPSGTC